MRVTPLLLGLGLLGACTDYELHGKDDTNDGVDTDADTNTPDDTDETPPDDEDCNGVDDNGDGQIDEGYPDSDGDGVKDCMDTDCDIELPDASTVTVDANCSVPDVVVTDPWNVKIEWQWTGLASNPSVHNVIMTPVIGNLTDDDGDGFVTESDDPDIVFVAFPSSNFTTGSLVVLDGKTGTEHWNAAGFNGGGGIALADVTGDGNIDILAFDGTSRPVAVNAKGVKLWTGASAVGTTYPQATVADVDGDGNAEVLADNMVLDGVTGAVERTFTIGSGMPYRLPAVADIDLDGVQEVILGNTAYDPLTGAVEWTSPITGGYGHWAAILDADGDPEAEVAMVGQGRLGIYQHDGTQLYNVAAGTTQPGPPCVADFDGDGAAEIAWASSTSMNLYELDGTKVWSQGIDDSSGLAGCSGYDIDGDGAYEILYADQNTLHVFDGRTGAINFAQTGHASGTLWEYPAVADIDNDGSAEIVIGSNNYWMSGWGGITVFGHNGSGWLKSGTTWHTHDFAVTNINPDGSVPAVPDPSWQLYNVYRARPAADDVATDLRVAITDVCAAGCTDDSSVIVAVQVYNYGGTDAQKNVPVTLYKNDGGTLTAISTQTLASAVASGTGTAGLQFDITVGDLGTDGILVRVDDDGTGLDVQTECDESNNEAVWTDTPC